MKPWNEKEKASKAYAVDAYTTFNARTTEIYYHTIIRGYIDALCALQQNQQGLQKPTQKSSSNAICESTEFFLNLENIYPSRYKSNEEQFYIWGIKKHPKKNSCKDFFRYDHAASLFLTESQYFACFQAGI